MPNIRELVEALPECEPKGALRGLVTAAQALGEEDSPRTEALERMAAVVRRWREKDPLTSLEAELSRRLGTSRSESRPEETGGPGAHP
jgi:hypothetical protein